MADSSSNGGPPNRRSSISQTAMTDLFQRAGSISGASPFAQPIPAGSKPAEAPRRRLSVGKVGLTGTSPTNNSSFAAMRRASTSTNSDSIDESAIEDDDYPGGTKTAPTTPFTRHMSFGAPSAMRNYRPSGSPNDQQGYNWSEQLRTRAESSVSGARPSFSLPSGSRGSPHDRAKSVSDMPQPPIQAPAPVQKPERAKPDAFQERILKGDFYMD